MVMIFMFFAGREYGVLMFIIFLDVKNTLLSHSPNYRNIVHSHIKKTHTLVHESSVRKSWLRLNSLISEVKKYMKRNTRFLSTKIILVRKYSILL